MDYVPTRTWAGNKLYLLSTILAHNLTRELQMIAAPPQRNTTQKRPALWAFTQLKHSSETALSTALVDWFGPKAILTIAMSAQ